MKTDWIQERLDRFTGKFLEPKDGLIVNCPLHGRLGRSSAGGSLLCPECNEWFPAIPAVPMTEEKLALKQAALQRRIAQRGQPRKRRQRYEDAEQAYISATDREALRRRIEARQAGRDTDESDNG